MFRILIAASCALATCAFAGESERFVGQARLPDGQTVVVAEGDLEARSVGSYSVRLYEAADVPNATSTLRSGIVVPRMGVVERLLLTDADSDGETEVVVITRSVGTGGDRSARVFDVAEGIVDPLITIDDLAADADVLAVLRERATVRDEVKKRQADRLRK